MAMSQLLSSLPDLRITSVALGAVVRSFTVPGRFMKLIRVLTAAVSVMTPVDQQKRTGN